uniref:Uncharacterized protein n=1 Tax=Grammatophora oceanica TaxID=210454 RepID=A0A7S1VA55_9STRA|mmetsp:Transcript_41132/g.60906  ORF Transcript_41132/g.60906 Transcript_41132/m.60906 type:complete len:192 (+) Transcript_41132:291-866(+)
MLGRRRYTHSLANLYLSCNRATRASLRRRAVVSFTSTRGFASDDDKKAEGLPFGLEKIFGSTEPDNLIPTDKDRKTRYKKPLPDFITPDVKKDLEELGVDSIEELDELEEKNNEGYNDLGLVPPEGTGTFKSPILIPSRFHSRVVGYQDPTTHAMFWFSIHNDNNAYYIKDLGLFFKMLHIPDPEVQQDHH